MAFLKSEIRSRSAAKRKKRERPGLRADASPHSTNSSLGSQHPKPSSRAALGEEGQAEKDGLLRVKKTRIQSKTESEELRSVLVPLAAAGAGASSGAAGLLAHSTSQLLPIMQQQEQLRHTPNQPTLLQQNKGEVRVLEDLLLRKRLPLLRSCLLPSPSPSLRSLLLERLAVEAGAFPASFSPFQLLSTSTALPASRDDEKDISAEEVTEDNQEGKALVAFLNLLKDALYAAPTAAVSFDAKGRIHGRQTVVLLKHVCQNPAPQISDHQQPRNSTTLRTAHSSSRRSDSSSRSDDSTCCNSSSISSKDGSGASNNIKSIRKSKEGVLNEAEGNIAEAGEGQKGEKRKGGQNTGKQRTAFTFRAPVAVHVVGSFPLNLCSSFSKNVDVCVMMPAHMFGMKDRLNYRYFNKRNVYVQLLYEHLRDLFIYLFPSSYAATASEYLFPASGELRHGNLRIVTGRPPSDADPSAASVSVPASKRATLDQDPSSAIDAACSRCSVSAAAFRAVAPHVLPRVFLQAWQGCIEKPVVTIRFLAIQKKPQEGGVIKQKHASSSDKSEPYVLPLQQEGQRVPQQQLLLQQWTVRVLAVPSAGASMKSIAKLQSQHQNSEKGDSSVTSNSFRKKGGDAKGGQKKMPFAEHSLAVDRNCVRVPTTCCRSLSSATSLVPSAVAFENAEDEIVGKQEQQQGTENWPPTPYYNMLLLEDLRLRQHQRLLYRCCKLYGDGFRKAVLLLKVWALRRGLLAADNTCFSSSSYSPPALVRAGAAADEDVFCGKEASDVNGFLLAMLCCHASLCAADTLATPLLPQQLLALTWSFLAEANFLQFVYILGDPQAYRRHRELKSLRAALCGGSESAVVGNLAEAGIAGHRKRKKSSSVTAGELTGVQSTAEGSEQAIADALLAPGLMEEAYLFDSSSCCFNLLWRAQLHMAELQQEARSSLQALQQSADAFHFVFAPPPSASFARISNSNGGNEHSQLYGLLHGGVQLYIPRVPQQPNLYLPAAAYPLGNYLPFTKRPQRPRHDTAAGTTTSAVTAAAVTSTTNPAALDALPKWETPNHVLLGSSLLRLFVRGLGDRLRCYRVRVRRACCPSATTMRSTAVTGFAAHQHTATDLETHGAVEGQVLAWTAESAEDFLRRGSGTTGLVVSLELNAAKAARLVERGPSAAVTASASVVAAPLATGAAGTAAGASISAAAGAGAAAEAIESFKLFWGPCVEVRRFHDAQTLYAVVWQRPSGEEEQLQALLYHSSGVLSPAADTASSCAAAPPSAVLRSPHHPAAGRVAGAADSAAAAVPVREQQLQIYPPPHTQIIRHLLQRHLSHVLHLGRSDDELQQRIQQQHRRQQNRATSGQRQRITFTKNRRESSSVKVDATCQEPATNAGICYLESTPLGAVPGLSQRHKQLIQTFNELRNTICALSSLPLSIKQIWHAGAALRFADAFPLPNSNKSSTCVGPDEADLGLHRVVVEFEDSAAWPDDMAAVRHVKIAFLLAMRKELLSDHGISGVVSPCASLDVELGVFTFRIMIFHPAEAAEAAALYAEPRWEPLYSHLRERSRHTELVCTTDSRGNNSSSTGLVSGSQLLRLSREGKSKEGYRQQQDVTEDAAVSSTQKQVQQQLHSLFSNMDAEEEDAVLARPFANPLFAKKCLDAHQQEEEERRINCLRYMWWEPQVAAVLHACALRYPPFAGCVRLAKRWVAEMQLPACMHLLEHIVASLFVETGKWGFPAPPQSVHVAFVRFLYVVTSFHWEDAPFIVCFDPDAPLGQQSEHLMKLSFEKFHHYPSVQSLFDPHGFVIPLPDAVTFTRFVHAARHSLAKILRIPLCPSLASSIWKSVLSFDQWSSMDFILLLRKNPLATETNSSKKRYANDPRFSSLPYCLASTSVESGETAAVVQLLLRAAASSEQQVEGIASHVTQPGARILFSPAYVRRFLFLRFLKEILCSPWTANEDAFRATEPALFGVRSLVSLCYNPLKAALQGGGMPGVVGIKLNSARTCSGGYPLFFARSVQPSVTFPRCCFSLENAPGEHGGRKADVEVSPEAITDKKAENAAGLSLELDCLNPVLLMAGFCAAGGELVESIQVVGC